MNNLRRALTFAALICLPVSTAFANKKEDEAAALIQRAQALSDLRTEGSPPFLLKANLRITYDDGSVTEGAYTEFWSSYSQWRKDLAFGDLHRTEITLGKENWTVGKVSAVSDRVGDLGALFDFPLHNVWSPNKIRDKRIEGIAAVHCIRTKEETGYAPELCFDKAIGTLISSTVFDVHVKERMVGVTCVYRDYRQFGERLVPASYECIQDKKVKIEVTLVELTLRPEFARDVFTPPPDAKESSRCASRRTPPRAVHSEEPHISKSDGVVNIGVTVGKDGRPHALTIVRSLDASSDAEAVRAVRNWRFDPATCDGEPINSQIVVQIDMHLYPK